MVEADENHTHFDFDHMEVRDLSINQIVDIYAHVQAGTEKYFVAIYIEGKQQRFEVDSGAGFTLLPYSQFVKLQLHHIKIQKTSQLFRDYNKQICAPIGVVQVRISYKNCSILQTLYIVPDKHEAVLGRPWIRRLNISLQEIAAE